MPKKTAVLAQAAQVRAVGGEVWVADETALREFPPLRATWSQPGQPTNVVISGRNGRRTILGALQTGSGELVAVPRARCRTDDVLALIADLSLVRPEVPKLLVWDNAPPHQPRRVREAAGVANITIAFLPFRSPELMPLEDLWRHLKAVVAANRAYASLEELVQRALVWLTSLTDTERRTKCGLTSSKFDWLPT